MYYLSFFLVRLKKKGDSTSKLELGMGPVGIMHAGTWEFEVS